MYRPEKLTQRRNELSLSRTKIADILGISRQSYFAWEKGISKPNKNNLKRLAEVLEVSTEYFFEDEIATIYNKLNDKNQRKAVDYVYTLLDSQNKVIEINSTPLFEYKVYEKMSAGIGSSVYDNGEYDTVYFDKELAHDFASWISGDSMEPTYQNGSVALIRETGFDYDGAVYAVVWNEQTFIKKVYREENGLRLVSINKSYSDKIAPYDENPRIVGKIVGNFIPMEV